LRHRLWQRTQWQQWCDDPAPSFGASAAEPQCEPGDFVGDGDELFEASSFRADLPEFVPSACYADEAMSEEELPLMNLKGLCSEGFDNIRLGFRDLLGQCRELRQLVASVPWHPSSAGPLGPVVEASAMLEDDPPVDVVVLSPASKRWICSSVAARREEVLQDPSCIDLPLELGARAALTLHSAATVAEAHKAVVDQFGSEDADGVAWYEDMLFYAIEDVRTGNWG